MQTLLELRCFNVDETFARVVVKLRSSSRPATRNKSADKKQIQSPAAIKNARGGSACRGKKRCEDGKQILERDFIKTTHESARDQKGGQRRSEGRKKNEDDSLREKRWPRVVQLPLIEFSHRGERGSVVERAGRNRRTLNGDIGYPCLFSLYFQLPLPTRPVTFLSPHTGCAFLWRSGRGCRDERATDRLDYLACTPSWYVSRGKKKRLNSGGRRGDEPKGWNSVEDATRQPAGTRWKGVGNGERQNGEELEGNLVVDENGNLQNRKEACE